MELEINLYPRSFVVRSPVGDFVFSPSFTYPYQAFCERIRFQSKGDEVMKVKS